MPVLFGIAFLAILAVVVAMFIQFRRFRWPPGIRKSPGVSLPTTRVAPAEFRPLALRAQQLGVPAEQLLDHVARLAGVRVVATKTSHESDGGDFEGYFLYKERLFILQTGGFVTIALLGQPPDERLFAEIESHVQKWSEFKSFLRMFTAARFWFLPRTPPQDVIDRYYPDNPQASVAKRWSVARSSKTAVGAGVDPAEVDPLAEVEVYLALGRRDMAITILEHASQANPARADIRKRLLELKAGS